MMSEYFETTASASYYERGVDSNDKNFIVNKHNEYRHWIAEGRVPGFPKARNMRTIRYDDALAYEAQKIADTCIYGHVPVHDGRWHHVGQNIYTWWSNFYQKGADWAGALKYFYDEYPLYRYGDRTTNKQNGHFTQMIWANTDSIGCGYSHYPISRDGQRYQKFYVCNYGPGGNYEGQLPYEAIY